MLQFHINNIKQFACVALIAYTWYCETLAQSLRVHKFCFCIMMCNILYSRRMAFCEHTHMAKWISLIKGAATKWLNKVIIVGIYYNHSARVEWFMFIGKYADVLLVFVGSFFYIDACVYEPAYKITLHRMIFLSQT